jgi:hypothetical protein
MSTCPRIVVYESADAPPAHRFLSCFYTPAGKALPMVFNAPDREAAISAASCWWANEQARLAKGAANAAARSARMRRPA